MKKIVRTHQPLKLAKQTVTVLQDLRAASGGHPPNGHTWYCKTSHWC